MNATEFYSRKDIQKEIIEISKNREVSVMIGEKGFGKRPDILQFESDIPELIKQGATSFHISEERWSNPLLLKPGMSKKQLDELRIGWDLVLDIDAPDLEKSKKIAFLIIEALKFHDIKNIFIKYSGNKGFHIAVPFEAFPSKVNEIETRLLFPEGLKTITAYLNDMIKENQKVETNIDTILISNRHLFRAPYSFHEKTGLISTPINPNDVLNFEKEQAKPENITTKLKFLKKPDTQDAKNLIIQAFDWQLKKPEVKIQRKYQTPIIAIKKEFFPNCILNILNGLDDGRKRSLFILTNFLKSTGYPTKDIEAILLEWNKKNKEPLPESYIKSQLNWHKSQKKSILPPNCDNSAYYKDILICQKDPLCAKIKNPVNYTIRKLSFKKQKK